MRISNDAVLEGTTRFIHLIQATGSVEFPDRRGPQDNDPRLAAAGEYAGLERGALPIAVQQCDRVLLASHENFALRCVLAGAWEVGALLGLYMARAQADIEEHHGVHLGEKSLPAVIVHWIGRVCEKVKGEAPLVGMFLADAQPLIASGGHVVVLFPRDAGFAFKKVKRAHDIVEAAIRDVAGFSARVTYMQGDLDEPTATAQHG